MTNFYRNRVMETAVVIANWNGKKYLKACLDSIESQSLNGFKVIFVDNGSDDGSVDFVRDNYLEARLPSVEVVKLKENTGFSFGYNTGIRKALEDEKVKYVIILNNDTKLDRKFVEKIVECKKRHPEAGSVQPKVLNFFEKDRIDCAGILLSADGVAVNRGYGEKDRDRYGKEEEIFGPNGTASLFSREALEKTQLGRGEYFDNSYFAYYEDVDLAWRMRTAGFKSFYCPEAFLFHVHSATANKISGFKAYYLNRNRFFTLIKNYSFSRLFLIMFILSPARYLYLLARIIMKKGRKGAEFSGQSKIMVAGNILRAWGSVVANIPALLKKRSRIRTMRRVSEREISKWFREYKVKWPKTF